MAAEQPHLQLLQVKLDYIPNILPQTGCLAKFAFRLQRRSKWAKSAIFAIFFFHFFEYVIVLQNLIFFKFFIHLIAFIFNLLFYVFQLTYMDL